MTSVRGAHGGVDDLARPVTVALAAGTTLLMVSFVTTFGVNCYVTDIRDVRDLFDVGTEANVATWWNTLLLLAIAASAILVAALLPASARRARRSWGFVAVVATAFSIDEAAGIHEQAAPLGRWVADRLGWELPTYAWVVPGVVVGGAIVVVGMSVVRDLPAHVVTRLAAAIGLFLAGALGVESVNGWMRDRDLEYGYFLGTTLEETLEMGACLVAVNAAVSTLGRRRSEVGVSIEWTGPGSGPVSQA